MLYLELVTILLIPFLTTSHPVMFSLLNTITRSSLSSYAYLPAQPTWLGFIPRLMTTDQIDVTGG